jgi:hypothetical protein
VTAFTIPAASRTLDVAIQTFTATDNRGVIAGWLVTESSTKPAANDIGWSATPPASYSFATDGAKTLYAWAKDPAGNISSSLSASVAIDTVIPVVTSFTLHAAETTLAVPITSLTATDDHAVTGYLVTESSSTPDPGAMGWSATAPTYFTFANAGAKTLYAWAKDAAGNVSTSANASVTITLPARPEPAGWYAGDMHVHRSCGGDPSSLATMLDLMTPQNLDLISLLADMGTGEVQDATTDLPLVGQDDPVSRPGRLVHWDAEWHWDPTYTQYPHQALGGHIVALGVDPGQTTQQWHEYTAPVLEWAMQHHGIGGFAHMQYLDGFIPSDLNCCKPLEYPVEVALGTAAFVSEDVVAGDQGYQAMGQMDPEAAIQAYYRLLNTGFRPGFAAGTDYPCNGGADLGSLLTYVRLPAGVPFTYQGWVQGIAAGRTVVSRNGHHEFLDLVVNGTARPGDQVDLPAGGPVSVALTWTADQDFGGTLELLVNGTVVASTPASLASPTFAADINFPRSGWIAARRMNANGHQVQTGAVFVVVNGAPVRASAADAGFFTQWMDNLLAATGPGGDWASFFPNDLSTVRARYQLARDTFQQVVLGSDPPADESIFTVETPNDSTAESTSIELGTKFRVDMSGSITGVRVYAAPGEQGLHSVRIWKSSDGSLVAGPYDWDVPSGSVGWTTFTLPAPVPIAAGPEYILSVSTGPDLNYSAEISGFVRGIVNGHVHTYPSAGVYTYSLGTMPNQSWNDTSYFRDVVFAPTVQQP